MLLQSIPQDGNNTLQVRFQIQNMHTHKPANHEPNIIFHTTDTGKKTREYITLRQNISSLVDDLYTVPRCKDQLCLKFIENEWIGTAVNPSEKELVVLALNRVEKDSQTFHKFVSLLSEIGGLKEIAKELMTKLKSADFY